MSGVLFQRKAYPLFPGVPCPPTILEKTIGKLKARDDEEEDKYHYVSTLSLSIYVRVLTYHYTYISLLVHSLYIEK